ncbi:DUF4046 domain-containing protein [Candidatus Woesearchaeota archaeon]|nr:DUF4046 domain-containing protein [Candidatus Woesearchaeota archaeon]
MNLDEVILDYESDIKRIAWRYYSLWPRTRFYDVDDLMQAGRRAIWELSQKRPKKLTHRAYVKSAIGFRIINEIKSLVPSVQEVHLIRQNEEGEEFSLIDLIPVYDGRLERLENLEELYHQVSQFFSEEDAHTLRDFAERNGIIFDLNLSEPPTHKLKDKFRLVLEMDLSDEDMLTYANTLIGALDTFPRDYVIGQNERAKKYIRFLVSHLAMTPIEFAQSENKKKVLKKYGLDSFLQRIYQNRMEELFEDVFPDVEPFMIWHSKRWDGPEGLINAYCAIDWLRRSTGKKPEEITRKDFLDFKLSGLLKSLFENYHRRAVEFRYSGNYPEHNQECKELWDKLIKNQ